MSYLHQILSPQFPKAGLQAQKEFTTLASGLDLLLEGELGRVGDLLLDQRFKAVEASLAELTEAARAELRAQKLRNSGDMSKGGGGAHVSQPSRKSAAESVDFRDAKKVELTEASSRQAVHISEERILQRSGSPNGTSNISWGRSRPFRELLYSSKARTQGSTSFRRVQL